MMMPGVVVVVMVVVLMHRRILHQSSETFGSPPTVTGSAFQRCRI
jgi:hypothetical protein